MAERSAVVFIHGLWLHASSWDRWVDLFAARGYTAVAPGWPGDEPTVGATRRSASALCSRSITEVTEHYARIAAGFAARSVPIGHGLGGLLALTLATATHAAGVIAIDVLPVTAMRSRTREPAAGRGAVALTRDEFHAVYGIALSRQESDQLYDRWAIPAPEWALREPVGPSPLAPGSGRRGTNSSRGPTLLVASAKSVGSELDGSAERGLLGSVSDIVAFADRGPSLVIDGGWRPVAESCLSWMDAHEL
jgi:pimeloyl-ACP methyl ester carboxylesterase